jgi:pimeloyl-ACP methyl ester carboxylesterase
MVQRVKPKAVAGHYVEVNGIRIRYIEGGPRTEGPPLLMVHGYNGSSDYFLPHGFPKLARERRIVAPDMPGCGLSKSMRNLTFESYVRFLPDFLDAIGVERADLLGHSMGGQISISSVVAYPERFRKLVLVDSSGLPEMIRRPWLVPVRSLADPCMRHISFYPALIKTALRGRAGYAGARMLLRRGTRQLLRQMRIPTLIIWGLHDRTVPVAHGRFMAQQIPGARLEVIERAGHMPFLEKPEEFSRLVLDFLKQEQGGGE